MAAGRHRRRQYHLLLWGARLEAVLQRELSGPAAPSNLTSTVDDGTTITSPSTFTTDPAHPGVWTGLSNSFTTDTAASLTLRIVNSNLAASGNDFGIDDLSFSTTSIVLEPASWALLVSGMAMVGVAARRRRATVVA